jgi:hypothetical protein
MIMGENLDHVTAVVRHGSTSLRHPASRCRGQGGGATRRHRRYAPALRPGQPTVLPNKAGQATS